MKVKLSVLGVRGSLPVADRQFMEYGGNTSCLFLEHGDEILCFDAGSGLSGLQSALSTQRGGLSGLQDGMLGAQDGLSGPQDGLSGPQDGLSGSQDGLSGPQDGLSGSQDGMSRLQDGLSGPQSSLSGIKRLHILISHVHIDHILGLVNLSSLKGPEIHLYGQGGRGSSFQKQLETVIGMPYWPVVLSDMGNVYIHDIDPKAPFLLSGTSGDIRIRMLHGNHPGGSLLYRAEVDGISITHALDCELDERMFSRLTEFAAGSSLLIWDANFVKADKRPGWGHSTWEEGLALGRAAGVRRVLMTHYSREYTDSFLQEQELLAGREDSACIFAKEGMVIEL